MASSSPEPRPTVSAGLRRAFEGLRRCLREAAAEGFAGVEAPGAAVSAVPARDSDLAAPEGVAGVQARSRFSPTVVPVATAASGPSPAMALTAGGVYAGAGVWLWFDQHNSRVGPRILPWGYVGNALRYGRRARVTIDLGVDCAIVAVEDDGPGIDPENYERAARPFVRLDPARGASRGSGVGLGLAIVADAMRSHGGRLELGRGQTPGYGGLIARLVVPLRPAQ